MPYKLIAPGKRKGNRHYIIRGTVDGQRLEIATHTADKGTAERNAPKLVADALAEAAQRDPDQELSFEEAARLYIAFRLPRKVDRQRIEKLVVVLRKPVKKIVHADLVAAANDLYPGMKASTKNRNAMRPAAAILHYAAKNGWRDWLRIELFAEPRPGNRAAPQSTKQILMANTEGKKRLLIQWLFEQGSRITDTMRIGWDQIDLNAATVTMLVSKKRGGAEWRTLPLDDALIPVLANEDKDKPLWPWETRSGVYKWLRPLVRRLGVTFTPHMGRHALGTALNASGAGLKTIMKALGQDDEKSAARYATADIEVVREAKRKLGAAPIKRRGKR